MYIYAALPEFVAYHIDDRGGPVESITRDTFFFYGIIAFLIVNFLLIIPAKLIDKRATLNFKRLFPKHEPFTDHMLGWLYSFGAILNITLATIAFYIHSINNQNEISSGEFIPFFYMIPVLFLIWIIALFVILGKKLREVSLS